MGRSDVLHGSLDLLVLKALSAGPLHGYAIGQRISQFAEDVLRVEEGSLYPALHRMEQAGWIAAEWSVTENNRRARVYRLTRNGQKRLDEEMDKWARLTTGVRKFLRVP